ncbi:hypothetical protein V6N13_018887 [Hibiscus sabdariffa]
MAESTLKTSKLAPLVTHNGLKPYIQRIVEYSSPLIIIDKPITIIFLRFILHGLVSASFTSQIGTKQWRYYDFGPKVVPPLICLPGTAGTTDVYYKQIMSLSMKVVS